MFRDSVNQLRSSSTTYDDQIHLDLHDTSDIGLRLDDSLEECDLGFAEQRPRIDPPLPLSPEIETQATFESSAASAPLSPPSPLTNSVKDSPDKSSRAESQPATPTPVNVAFGENEDCSTVIGEENEELCLIFTISEWRAILDKSGKKIHYKLD